MNISFVSLSHEIVFRCTYHDAQVKIEQGHLQDALRACTDQSHIALEVLRLNEELDLKVASKMYARALEVGCASIHCRLCFVAMYARRPRFDLLTDRLLHWNYDMCHKTDFGCLLN